AVNLRPFEDVAVRHGDALALDLAAEGVDAVYADPARRTRRGTRVFDPRAYSPDLDTLLAIREKVPALGLKVGPGIPYRALPSQPGDADAAATQAPSGPLSAFLYEPDGAVIRAGLVARLAEDLDGTLVDPSIAYITTTAERPTPFATGFRVLDSFDFGLKRLRAYLRTRDVERLTIKKRGTAVVPDQLRQQLHLKGSAEATIVLTRLAGKQSVLVVEPLAG